MSMVFFRDRGFARRNPQRLEAYPQLGWAKRSAEFETFTPDDEIRKIIADEKIIGIG